jgi:purine-cytosine permease-like protein
MQNVSAEQSPSSGEFEREPVPQHEQLGLKSFVGMYAGEHCAGTELMIGPLFVAAGVSAFDVIVGLVVGNLLAVLSWVFLTAPIATRARLTLYYQLEKVCGRKLVTLYNLANGVMFCFLAGAMITVSATAVGVWVEFPMPKLDDIYPNSLGWVFSVLGVGLLISVVAAYGYKTVSRVANIAAPWMVLVFLAFGFVALRQFIVATDTEIRSAGDLWRLATTHIWRGGEPLPGQVKFTFWHVTFFAWFCNMAMHIGMADLSVLRFARKSWYGVASAAGMYVGHFMAWICASMLFAFQLHESGLISDEAIRAATAAGALPTPLPGPLAYGACGIAGLLCVIVAGWTTANPTIYRAGLAFQAIVPRRSRFAVTLVTGAVATVAALFPALAMKLLDFVALYGMLLMPMGAVVFIDFWLLDRLGMRRYDAEKSGLSINWAAGLTWLLTLTFCLVAVFWIGRWSLWFVSLPGWFVAAALYLALSRAFQRPLMRPAGAASEERLNVTAIHATHGTET